ncbi:MAG: single-stranded-DNA-specific exonuclease RecJ [Clostridiales bacterium]|nr:single-stranded-DNA-specific exonuclease RecJ [Clostridiales bacterium]
MLLTSPKWRFVVGEPFSSTDALFEALLKSHGINTPKEREDFLTDQGAALYDPFLYNDMRKAVDIICEAMSDKRKILVYGDYDCDGVTATSILVRYFRSHGCDVSYIVPNREEHGYGLTKNIIEDVLKQDPYLLITVDCGITNIDTVSELKARGMKVIVTDHHNVQDEIPNADAVICAKRKDNTYPFIDLCGAGVALKIVQAMGTDRRFPVSGDIWRQAIELAGIATIADLVSVVDENRTIVKKAFISMKNPVNPGIRVMNEILLENAGSRKFDETFVSFNFVPRVNAAGRLYDSSEALNLFLEDDVEKAREAAISLGQQNDERKQIEARVYEEAVKQIEDERRPDEWSLANTKGPIIAYDSKWHQGVLGIVAGRLSSAYKRSAIVFTADSIDPLNLKGSGRAYGDYDLFAALGRVSDKLINFGGHKKAAGVTLRKSDLTAFMRALEDDAVANAGENEADDVLDVTAKLKFNIINFDTYEAICKFKPYGIGNKKPLFVTERLVVVNINDMTDGAHIRLDLADADGNSDQTVSAVGFGMGIYTKLLKPGDIIDIAYTMNEYTYKGKTSISLYLEDIKLAGDGSFLWQKADIAEDLYRSGMELDQIAKLAKTTAAEGLIPTKVEYLACYQIMKNECKGETSYADIPLLARMITNESGVKLTPFKVARCLEVFSEAHLIKLGVLSSLRVCFRFHKVEGKTDLKQSAVYMRLLKHG